jgi:hypothetical protein
MSPWRRLSHGCGVIPFHINMSASLALFLKSEEKYVFYIRNLVVLICLILIIFVTTNAFFTSFLYVDTWWITQNIRIFFQSMCFFIFYHAVEHFFLKCGTWKDFSGYAAVKILLLQSCFICCQMNSDIKKMNKFIYLLGLIRKCIVLLPAMIPNESVSNNRS